MKTNRPLNLKTQGTTRQDGPLQIFVFDVLGKTIATSVSQPPNTTGTPRQRKRAFEHREKDTRNVP